MDCDNKNLRIVLLQSGGRDSAIAAANLLEKGHEVLAVTFAANARQMGELPRGRAREIASRYDKYSWQMIEFGGWDRPFKQAIVDKFGELPKSCLACALSKMTAALRIAQSIASNGLAMGYTEYHNHWSEQTPVAIATQRSNLEARGYSFLLPAQSVDSKASAIEILASSGLTSHALENPCCISQFGTQPMGADLIVDIVNFSFAYFDKALAVPIEVVDSLGGGAICP